MIVEHERIVEGSVLDRSGDGIADAVEKGLRGSCDGSGDTDDRLLDRLEAPPIRAWLIAAGRRNDAEVCDRLCARAPVARLAERGRRGLPARDHDRDRGGVTLCAAGTDDEAIAARRECSAAKPATEADEVHAGVRPHREAAEPLT